MIPRTPTSTLFPYQPLFFFFNDTATTEIYTLSLHDALPISHRRHPLRPPERRQAPRARTRSGTTEHSAPTPRAATQDRKSTRLNSSHDQISYAVFCLKKKNTSHLPAPLPPVCRLRVTHTRTL